MMEVKHSPATQMEFRSSRNGLADNVEDELDTLFEEGDSKSLTLKADKCDAKLPILNGISKHQEESSPAKALNDTDVDLEKAKEAEDTELYELDLQPECTGATPNGESTDSSKLRDTGDDLDTLLSKINDLVEDCMEEPKASDAKAKEKAADCDREDVKDQNEESSKVKSNNKETEVQGEVQKEKKVDAKPDGEAEKEDSVIDSGKTRLSDVMEVDDFVFCLDSPLEDNKSQDDEEMVEAVEVLETIEDVETQEEEEVTDSTAPAAKEPAPAKPSVEEDDDVLLIEDDEEEETPMETESLKTEEKSAKKTEETKTGSEIEKEKEKEKVKEESEKVAESDVTKTSDQSKDAAKGKDDAQQANNEDDDDIVCLDDSVEEVEEKIEEASESKEPEAVVDNKKDEVSEKETEQTSEAFEKAVTEQIEKESLVDEPAPMDVEVEEVEKPADKPLDASETSVPTSVPTELPKEDVSKPEKSLAVTEDDDVVILDDDDDQPEATTSTTSTAPEKTIDQPSVSDSCGGTTEEAKTSKEEKAPEEESSSEKPSIAESSAIISDNSDNARDGVEEKEEVGEVKQAPEQASASTESNSTSASDNLLKESKKVTRTESEETNEQPPAKKLRLSQDESNSRLSVLSQEETKSNTQENENDETMENSKVLKRVRSTESLSSDFKKPKTDAELEKEGDSNSKDSKDVVPKIESKPLPLYPAPKLDPPTIDLSLDFLKRFKKTIHKMTKSDLEELVLQKIVEAIVHKSEFSEMRDLIEKQDKIIVGHRTKITELNKQFRDLEMVHNRVLKDLETKNAQFVMPVKITRAVGLQVFFPAKKFDPTLTPLAPQNSTPVPPAHAPHSSRSTSNLSAHSSDRPSHSSPVPVGSHTPKSSTSISTQAAGSSSVQQSTPPQRRGCVQKLTPLRPDTPRNSPLNRSIAAGVVSSSTPSPSTSKDSGQKCLNRSGGQKTRLTTTSITGGVKVPVTVIQNDAAPSDQLDQHRTMSTSMYSTSSKIKGNRGMETSYPKKQPKFGTSDPHSVSQPLPVAATVIKPSLLVNSSVTITPSSKPGQKSVIDLTDEDDVMPPAAMHSSKASLPPAAQASPAPQPPVSSSGRAYKVSVVPQQQLQQPKPNPPKQIQQRTNAPVAPKPNGIAVRQIGPAPSRYRHPAPLPNQPTHSSNPAWKLPPARPTIRISNLESGIVISWTIEDTAKEKYAESTSYQIYAYQETSGPPLVESWRHVGDVKAMLLPMAVTLTQFQEGQRYYFAVRAVDAHNRCGPFSFAKTWS